VAALSFSTCPPEQLEDLSQFCSFDQRFIAAPVNNILFGPVGALFSVVSKLLSVDQSGGKKIRALVIRAACYRSALILGLVLPFSFLVNAQI
jgi:hypothetical protein